MLTTVLILGSIYSLVTLGLVFSFRMVGFADLTVESSFSTGAAVTAILMHYQICSPGLTFLAAFLAGSAAGCLTALLHVKGGISRLLSGIIMMTVLYSVNLNIMGRSNLQLAREDSVFHGISGPELAAILLAGVGILYLAAFLILKTHFGYLLRACGESPQVVVKLGHHPGALTVAALAIGNGLTALSGAVAVHKFGYADVGMSMGLIVAALAALILGEAIYPPRSLARLLVAAFVGTLLYYFAYQVGINANINPWNLKILVGLLLAVALVIKRGLFQRRAQLYVGVDAL